MFVGQQEYDSQAREMHSAAAAALMMDASDEEKDEDESLLRLHDLEASAAAAADDWIYLGAPSESHAFKQRRGNSAKHVYNTRVSFKVSSCAQGRGLRGLGR